MSKVFLGITDSGKVILADINTRQAHQDAYFSVSFTVSSPICEKDIDVTQMYQNLIDETDYQWRWEMCEKLNCTPTQLASRLEDEEETSDRICNLIDNSCMPVELHVNRDLWEFQTEQAGQVDLTDVYPILTPNYVAYRNVINLWKKYHLKKIKDIPAIDIELIEEIKKILPKYNAYDQNSTINQLLADMIKETAYYKGSDELLDIDCRFTPCEIREWANAHADYNFLA